MIYQLSIIFSTNFEAKTKFPKRRILKKFKFIYPERNVYSFINICVIHVRFSQAENKFIQHDTKLNPSRLK